MTDMVVSAQLILNALIRSSTSLWSSCYYVNVQMSNLRQVVWSLNARGPHFESGGARTWIWANFASQTAPKHFTLLYTLWLMIISAKEKKLKSSQSHLTVHPSLCEWHSPGLHRAQSDLLHVTVCAPVSLTGKCGQQ